MAERQRSAPQPIYGSAGPHKQIDLYFPGRRARSRSTIRAPGSRCAAASSTSASAFIQSTAPSCRTGSRATRSPTARCSGAPGSTPAEADAVVWAIGKVRPNTGWLPDSLLDEHGFVEVGPTLQTRARPEIFAIGDVAATDPLRSSARNRADGLLADNIRAYLAGRPLKDYRASRSRWGSVLGVQDDGLLVLRCRRPRDPDSGLGDQPGPAAVGRPARFLPRRRTSLGLTAV